MTDQKLKYRDRRCKWFTLVELLLVVAVMLILLSLLFPALSSAKEKSRSIACIGNLKQLVGASMIYTADFDGQFAMGSYSLAGVQFTYLDFFSNGNYLSSTDRVYYCPGHSQDIYNKYDTYGGNMSDTTYRLPLTCSGYSWFSRYMLYKSSSPSSDSLFADSIFRIASSNFSRQCYRYWTYSLTVDGGIFLAHPGGFANMAFIDGHVEGCNDKKLKNIGITAYIDKNYNEFP